MNVLFRLLLLSLSCLSYAQMDYRALVVSNMPVRSPSILPDTPLNLVGGTVIFTGEQAVEIKPEGPAQNNEFVASASGGNYFLARIGMTVFADLKESLDASYIQTLGHELSFRYEEKYIDGSLNYQIYKFDRSPMITSLLVAPFNIQVVVGTNYKSLDLSTIPGMVHSTEDSYYVLEVTNAKGEVLKLRFKYTFAN